MAAQARESGGFGDQLARRFWLKGARSHVTRELRRGPLAITQIRSDAPTPEPSRPIGYDEAYLVGLMIDDVPDHELWQDGKAAATEPFRKGQSALYDLRRNPVSYTRTAHHSLHFYVPRSALLDLAERSDLRFSGELDFRFAAGHDDPVARSFGMMALASLESGSAADVMFLDHLLGAFAAHVLRQYGDVGPGASPRRGGLTASQLRRVEDLMHANLDGDLALDTLAASCGLSVGHFARAFRQTTGVAPYRHFLGLRIERAKTLLRSPERPLCEIAQACGFGDQSHFTRMFSRSAGMSPGRWRRLI